jgi:rhomboid family GlyGly-CTERM serine protease
VTDNPLSSVLKSPVYRPWLIMAAAVSVLQAVPDAGYWLRYDRAAIEAGEVWRLVTANFIHLGWGHLVLNIAGFLAIGWLFAEDYSPGAWFVILLACALASSVGLYLLNPDIFRVVGLSGALHGLFAAGAIAWIAGSDGLGKWLLAGLAAKLAYEQAVGAMPFSEGIVGGGVVTDAHLWGAIGGTLIALALLGWQRFGPRL